MATDTAVAFGALLMLDRGTPVIAVNSMANWHAGLMPQENDLELHEQLFHRRELTQTQSNYIFSHAGYSYCGETAAHAFKQIVPDNM